MTRLPQSWRPRSTFRSTFSQVSVTSQLRRVLRDVTAGKTTATIPVAQQDCKDLELNDGSPGGAGDDGGRMKRLLSITSEQQIFYAHMEQSDAITPQHGAYNGSSLEPAPLNLTVTGTGDPN